MKGSIDFEKDDINLATLKIEDMLAKIRETRDLRPV